MPSLPSPRKPPSRSASVSTAATPAPARKRRSRAKRAPSWVALPACVSRYARGSRSERFISRPARRASDAWRSRSRPSTPQSLNTTAGCQPRSTSAPTSAPMRSSAAVVASGVSSVGSQPRLRASSHQLSASSRSGSRSSQNSEPKYSALARPSGSRSRHPGGQASRGSAGGGYTSSAVADTGAHTGAGLIVYGPTLDALLDIPALTADGNSPGFYAAACGVMPTWPGALLYASYSNGQDWEDVATWDADSFMGTVATALGAATCFDRVDAAGTLTVSPYAGTLASVTEAQMLAGSNHFAYGAHGRWEILAARTVTLNGDATYTLQDFLRGRLGTEQYAGTHQAADRLVQLTTAETLFVSRSSAQIGLAALFRPVTVDEDFDEVQDEAFTYTGVNLKPLSPVDLNGNRHPTTNDWALTWLRRARINTEWRDYVDVALDEASEAYEVEIWTSGYTTLKRTLTGLTSATATYSSANQVADFGSNQATLYLKIYQLSASVGRGDPLTTSITR